MSDSSATSSPAQATLPGATLGVLGGGQLGRMFAVAALRLGYRVHVLTDAAGSPAAQVAQDVTVASYDDVDAVTRFASGVEALTIEFENISSAALEGAQHETVVRPGVKALTITQNRGREKAFLSQHGFPHVTFKQVNEVRELETALAAVGFPSVVKSAGFGYDGKGQAVVRTAADLPSAVALTAAGPVVVEERLDLAAELSVVVARSPRGEMVSYPPFLNLHRHQVLDLSLAPIDYDRAGLAGTYWEDSAELLTPELLKEVREVARAVMVALELVGVACVEFFLTSSGRLLVNEIAPRPHNSGHLTIEAAATSQFEQQVRAVTGLPLGSVDLNRPTAMINLLGELWAPTQPDWVAALSEPGAALHLYGKESARPGRKMGHITVSAASAARAQAGAVAARELLKRSGASPSSSSLGR